MALLKKAFLIAGCFALISFFAVSVNADDWNKATLITVNQPIEIPGRILPAGTYMFKLMDSLSDRHIVQIMSEDQAKLYQTILAIPDYRWEPTDKATITFYETPRGSLSPVRSWFYAGERSGVQFVYPKQRAETLAKVTDEHVPSTQDAAVTEQAQLSSGEVAVTKEEPAPAVLEKPSATQTPAATSEVDAAVSAEPATEVEPESQIALSAEPQVRSVESPQAPTPAPEERQDTGANRTLPKTASPDALYLLAGLGSAIAAYGVRRVRS